MTKEEIKDLHRSLIIELVTNGAAASQLRQSEIICEKQVEQNKEFLQAIVKAFDAVGTFGDGESDAEISDLFAQQVMNDVVDSYRRLLAFEAEYIDTTPVEIN